MTPQQRMFANYRAKFLSGKMIAGFCADCAHMMFFPVRIRNGKIVCRKCPFRSSSLSQRPKKP